MEENKVKESKIKNHFKKHKGKYIVVAGVGVGTTAGVLIGAKYKDQLQNKVGIVNVIVGKDNTINNHIIQLVKRGHAGNVIRCNETGEIFASQRRAAEVMGVSPSSIWAHLKGKNPHAGGYTFENLGEMTTSQE